MNKLPKHIADMVGIINDDGPSAPVVTKGEPMVSISFNPDGSVVLPPGTIRSIDLEGTLQLKD
jgi:hypothetical protein